MDPQTKLLIVDDDPHLLRAQTTLLERAGYRVFQAATGREALRLVREVDPQLILLDVMLPDIDGLEVCQRIKADPALAGTMVVLLSGVKTASHEQAEGLEAGADGVIARPVGNRELLARVEALLRLQRSEQRRRASEARYRDLFENAPIGIYATTPEGDILMANPPLVEMLGYDSLEELAERDLESEGYHPDYPRSAFKRRIEAEGQIVGLESAWRRKDGSTLFLRENARPIFDEDGRLIAYQGTVEDVTERVERTRRLERLNTVLDAIGEVNQLIVRERDRGRLIAGVCERLVAGDGYRSARIALLNEDGTLAHSAEAGLGEHLPATAGWEGELDLCGMEALSQPEVWVGEAREGCRLEQAYGDEVLMAARLEHADTVYGLMTVSLPRTLTVREEPFAQERTLFQEMASDIAFGLRAIALEEEHRKADRALRASERRQSLILNSTAEMFAYYNTDMEIQWANQAAADSVGLTREEMEGRHCYEVWHQRDEPCDGCPVSKALETKEPQETEQTTPDGRVWFVRGYPVLDEHGAVEALIEFGQDITEKRHAREALRRSEERYRVLFESTGTATCVFDDDGVIRMCNEGFVALAGLPREAIEGEMRWSDFVAEEDLARMQRYHAQRSAGRGNPPTDYRFTFIDARDRPRDIYLEIGMVPETGERIASLTDITPLKKAEEALRESEKRYRLLAETARDLILTHDLEGRITYVNQTGLAFTGYSRDEMLARNVMDFIAPGHVEDAVERQRKRAAGDDTPYLYESAMINRYGEQVPLEVSSAPIKREGQIREFLLVARDLTERREAEQALRESEERYRTLFESAPESVTLLDLDGVVVDCNPATEEIAELPREAIIGTPFAELAVVAPSDLTEYAAIFARLLDGDRIEPLELRTEPAEGDGRWLEVFPAPIVKDGEVEAVQVIARDITERRKAEQALRESEERYRRHFENVSDVIYSVDEDLNITDVSPSVERVLGYKPEELIGQPFVELSVLGPDSMERAIHDTMRVLSGERVESTVYRFIRRDGGERWAEVSGAPLTRDGEVAGLISVARDITERKEAEDELRRIEWLLERRRAPDGGHDGDLDQPPSYGDVTALNTDGLILGSVGRETLSTMLSDIMNLLETSVAVYERDGSYAYGSFVSHWCRYLDAASRRLCNTDDNREALGSGRWLCHDNCWHDSAQVAMEQGKPTDIACVGGIHMYAVPIRAGGEIIGAINVGYGNPPTDRETIEELAEAFEVDPDELMERARTYNPRPPFIVTVAKERLHAVARLIGEIVERRRAEAEAERLARFPSENPNPVLRVTETGTVLYANEPSRTLLRDWTSWPDEPLPDEWQAFVADVLDSGSSEAHEVEIGDRTLALTVAPMTNAGYVNIYGLDITERKQMERQLRQQEQLAAVGQLAGGIAHDFNNILAAIILYAQMPLGREKLTPSTQNALKTILEESHRAADLVQQILDFSRSAMMETEPLDLASLVENDASLLRRTIPEHIHLVTELTSRPCTVEADRTRIHQALMNLALNAKDAMPEGGQLRIGVERVTLGAESDLPLPDMPLGPWCRLTVSDTGTGLSDEAQTHLFEPFFTTKEEGEGTGLGLAQVYGIVKQHQGFIDVETAEDVGTTFTIYLPLVAREGDDEDVEEEANPYRGQGETILVVEDAERLRGAIQAGLETMGYRVLTAAHGRQAIQMVDEHEVDLVLTDVIMPHMGGEALLRALRASDPDLKVIAMTGHVVDTDVKGLEAGGFAEALPKPFSMEELTEAVRRVLDSDRFSGSRDQ